MIAFTGISNLTEVILSKASDPLKLETTRCMIQNVVGSIRNQYLRVGNQNSNVHS